MAADKGFALPTAQEVMEKLALAEAEKASAALRKQSDSRGREEDAVGETHQAVGRLRR